jgi:hypothetical protein
MLIRIKRHTEAPIPDMANTFLSLAMDRNVIKMITPINTDLRIVNFPYLVFKRKAGRIEKTSFRGVSVITEQCRMKWTALIKNVRTEIRNRERAANLPEHCFFPEGVQKSAPDGPVTKIFAVNAPETKTTPTRKNPYKRIIDWYARSIYLRVNEYSPVCLWLSRLIHFHFTVYLPGFRFGCKTTSITVSSSKNFVFSDTFSLS